MHAQVTTNPFTKKRNNGSDTRALSHARTMEVALKLTENASLRGMRNEDGVYCFSVYDFINLVTGRELGSSYGRVTFLRLTNGSEYASEIVTNCNSFKIQGSRGPETPCMTTRAACFEIESARQGTRQDTHACCDFGAGRGSQALRFRGPIASPLPSPGPDLQGGTYQSAH